MARHYTVGRLGVLRKRWLLVLVLVSLLAISMLVLLPLSSPFDSCDRRCQIERKARVGSVVVSPGGRDLGNPLGFMKSKLVLLVSQILSLVLLRFRLVGLILKLELSMVVTSEGGAKGCRLQVSNTKKPIFFYLNVEKDILD